MFASNASGSQASAGPDLEEIQTEALGFQALAGETKVRLLPSPWPSNNLPGPTSSLLSVAAKSGLVAAAGPDALVIASTDNLRQAFVKDAPAENNIKPFQPELQIQVPQVSQVAFTSDETFLAICAAQGGGLAVYDVQGLKQGNTQPAFQIATNGIAVRALVPNPNSSADTAQYVAVVLAGGQLMIADLSKREFMNGPNGPIFREGVSCVSWSAKGKQLVVGLGDATAVQLAPDGSVKAQIPRPPQLEGDQHVSQILWLANDTFLIIYTPTNFDQDRAPDSTLVLVNRQKNTSNFGFQKLPDPSPPFGVNRSPPHHFISRLRGFPPSLTDTLIVSSTASVDVGLVTSASSPLSNDPAAANAVNTYATTGLANDARKASLPVDKDQNDTSPIGMALDLSSKEPVKRPIPTEEIETSSTPLPALMILNNEGILSAWWFVYSDSVRSQQIYPELVAAGGASQQATSPTQSQSSMSSFGTMSQSQSQFGVSTFGKATSAQSAGAFGSPSPMGGSIAASASGSAFGGPSSLGGNKSAWGSNSASNISSQTAGVQFGRPTFGSSPAPSAFGSAGGLGSRTSVWGNANDQNSQTNGANVSSNPFSGGGAAEPSGFSAFASQTSGTSGFASLGGSKESSVLGGKPSTEPPSMPDKPSFGSTVTIGSNLGSSFGELSTFGAKSPWGTTPALSTNVSSGPFGQSRTPESPETEMTSGDMDSEPVQSQQQSSQPQQRPQGLFGDTGFKLKSTFDRDAKSADQNEKIDETRADFGFGLFKDALGDTKKSPPPTAATFTKQDNEESTPTQSTTQIPVTRSESDGEKKAEGSQLPASPSKPVDKSSAPTALPVSPTQTGPESDDAPLPPDFTKVKEEEEEIPPAPLPPSPSTQRAMEKSQESGLSPAGSPAVDLGGSESSDLSSVPSGELDDNSAEPEGTPEEAPLPPHPASKPSVFQFPSPFPKSQPPPASPGVSQTPQASTAATPPTFAKSILSQTPASATKPPILFNQPGRPQESPRSPSPVRKDQSAVGQRSLSSPNFNRKPQDVSTTPQAPPPSHLSISQLPPPSRIQVQAESLPPTRLPAVRIQSGRNLESSIAELVDDEDERVRAELEQDIEGTKRLAPFLAHQDYAGKVDGQGDAVQIEKLYRDINSMIDTLGLNARSLKAFILGQSESSQDRDRRHLENEDDWCLVEIDDLRIVEGELENQLEEERVPELPRKLADIQAVRYEIAQLRARQKDMLQTLKAESDARNASDPRGGQLTAEQSNVLLSMRRSFSTMQHLLGKAEEATSVLRARLASASSSLSDASAVPTVEAVLGTIAKMTRMIEQKSGDVDLLEAQMRRLRFRPRSGAQRATPPVEASLSALSLRDDDDDNDMPVATPPSSSSRTRRTRGSGSAHHSNASNASGTFELKYEDSSGTGGDDNDDGYDTAYTSASESEVWNDAPEVISLPSSAGVGARAVQKSAAVQPQSEREREAWREASVQRQRRARLASVLKERVGARGVQRTSSLPEQA